jgi:hypothetical protein
VPRLHPRPDVIPPRARAPIRAPRRTEERYQVCGIIFRDFHPLDVGGPQTVAALLNDVMQIGLLFSTDPRIGENGFAPLADDRHLQNAENVTPVIRSEKLRSRRSDRSVPLSPDSQSDARGQDLPASGGLRDESRAI